MQFFDQAPLLVFRYKKDTKKLDSSRKYDLICFQFVPTTLFQKEAFQARSLSVDVPMA